MGAVCTIVSQTTTNALRRVPVPYCADNGFDEKPTTPSNVGTHPKRMRDVSLSPEMPSFQKATTSLVRHIDTAIESACDRIESANRSLELFYHSLPRILPKFPRHRSYVRALSRYLPQPERRRVYFQLVSSNYTADCHWRLLHTRILPVFFDEDSDPVYVATLADVGWLVRESRYSDAVSPRFFRPTLVYVPPCPEIVDTDVVDDETTGSVDYQTKLEREIERLRAEMAMIIANSSSGVPLMNLTPPPSTSEEEAFVFLPPSPPRAPPPPPPPPPPGLLQLPTASVKDEIIKRRRSGSYQRPGSPDRPSMTDVLRGLKSVRLRSIDVERSPGGTPMRRTPMRSRNLQDPAAIIAQALQRKFAHLNKLNESPVERSSPEVEWSPVTGTCPGLSKECSPLAGYPANWQAPLQSSSPFPAIASPLVSYKSPLVCRTPSNSPVGFLWSNSPFTASTPVVQV